MTVVQPHFDLSTFDANASAQSHRRAWLYQKVRDRCKAFFDDSGRMLTVDGQSYDQRIPLELAMALLDGDDEDIQLAERVVTNNPHLIGQCAFSMDYALALLHAGRSRMTPSLERWLIDRITEGSVTSVTVTKIDGAGACGHALSHRGYNLRGMQWHGYNDNHVALGVSSIILAGELIGDDTLVHAGRASLMQLRDTLSRRGFIHEANDGYLPHTIYPLAAVAQWAVDPQCRQLAQHALDRIWSDLIGHWHPNLGRKLAPSARDYMHGRLSQNGLVALLGYVFGESVLAPWQKLADLFEPPESPRRVKFASQTTPLHEAWTMGYIARVALQTYVVPDCLLPLLTERSYPHSIIGTNEFGNMLEIDEEIAADGSKTQHGLTNVQYAGGPHLFTTYMEEDWGMGSADRRLLGTCPNNHFQIAYRKRRPLDSIAEQGNWYCSYTINDKFVGREHHLQLIEQRPQSKVLHGPIHFADAGRYALTQHQRTAIALYRPRPLEHWDLRSLALSLAFPMHFGNDVDELRLGSQRIKNWHGESATLCDILIHDGPVFIGFRPLINEPLTSDVRVRVARDGDWGAVHLYSYRGPSIAIDQEADLSRIGAGFVVEVATEDDFGSLDEFAAWFSRSLVSDSLFHWQRLVRYHRPADPGAGRSAKKLDLALRWDAWQDRILFRALNGRSLPEPQFECTGIDNADLPWLTDDASNRDNFSWQETLSNRPQHRHGHQPLPLQIKPGRPATPPSH